MPSLPFIWRNATGRRLAGGDPSICHVANGRYTYRKLRVPRAGRWVISEQVLVYVDEDELVEVTPKSLRLRKRFLDPHDRKRVSRAAKAA